jgi:hypothetical protein
MQRLRVAAAMRAIAGSVTQPARRVKTGDHYSATPRRDGGGSSGYLRRRIESKDRLPLREPADLGGAPTRSWPNFGQGL